MKRFGPLLGAFFVGITVATCIPSLGSGKIDAPNTSTGQQSTGTSPDKGTTIEKQAAVIEAQRRLIDILVSNDETKNRALIVMLIQNHQGMKATCDRLMAAEALYRMHRQAMEEQITADQAFMRQMELEQRGAKGKLYAFDWIAMHRTTMEQLGRSTRSRFNAEQTLSNGLARLILPRETEPSPRQQHEPAAPRREIARR